MSVNDDQSMPTPGVAPHSVDLVVMDLAERKRHGVAKYGVAHQFDNGRDHLIDVLQEGYDFVIYLRAEVEKRKFLRTMAEQLPHDISCSMAGTGSCDCITGAFKKMLGELS